jgi:hypothetical protein
MSQRRVSEPPTALPFRAGFLKLLQGCERETEELETTKAKQSATKHLIEKMQNTQNPIVYPERRTQLRPSHSI